MSRTRTRHRRSPPLLATGLLTLSACAAEAAPTTTAPPSRPTPRRARTAAPRPDRRTGHPGSRRPPREAGQGPSAACGRDAYDDRDARQLHAVRALRHRHRRLPVLPARPRARQGLRGSPAPRSCPATPTSCTTSSSSRSRPSRSRRRRPRTQAEDGEGWTCFGGTGLDRFQNVDDVAVDRRLGARRQGVGDQARLRHPSRRRAAGSSCRSTTTCSPGRSPTPPPRSCGSRPANRDYQALSTMLLPAPVELPCRPKHDDGELCDRDAALADVKERFGAEGNTADLLHLLCGGKPEPGQTQSCLRTLSEPITIHGVAGHMHLLGRSIKIEVRPGTPQAQTDPRHPGLGLRRPGQPPDRADHARSRSSRSR